MSPGIISGSQTSTAYEALEQLLVTLDGLCEDFLAALTSLFPGVKLLQIRQTSLFHSTPRVPKSFHPNAENRAKGGAISTST